MVIGMIDDIASHRYEQIAVSSAELCRYLPGREGDRSIRPAHREFVPNRLRSRGADYLAYALIDAIVDSYFPPVGPPVKWSTASRPDVEHDAQAPDAAAHRLRRDANVLKGVLWPMRDALAALIRNDVPYVTAETKIFLNDTLDHTLRLIELVETQRDMLTGLIEMHLLTQPHQWRHRYLTIISVIFMPHLLVGVYGMNFDPDSSPWNMPELRAYYGYPASLVFMLLVAIGLIAFFRWKKWL